MKIKRRLDQDNLSGQDDGEYYHYCASDPMWELWLWEREVDRDLNEDLIKMYEEYKGEKKCH